MQANDDITANTASTDAISTKPAIVWRGDWVSDLDGIYETRALVSACGSGFLPGLEVSFQGGEPVGSAAVDAVGTLPVAMEAALALGRLWHQNNSGLCHVGDARSQSRQGIKGSEGGRRILGTAGEKAPCIKA